MAGNTSLLPSISRTARGEKSTTCVSCHEKFRPLSTFLPFGLSFLYLFLFSVRVPSVTKRIVVVLKRGLFLEVQRGFLTSYLSLFFQLFSFASSFSVNQIDLWSVNSTIFWELLFFLLYVVLV